MSQPTNKMRYKIGKAVFEPISGTEVNLWSWWPDGSRSKVVLDENQMHLMGGQPELCNTEEARVCVTDGLKYLCDEVCPCYVVDNVDWAEKKRMEANQKQPTSQREELPKNIELLMRKTYDDFDPRDQDARESDAFRNDLGNAIAQAKLTWQEEVRGEILELERKNAEVNGVEVAYMTDDFYNEGLRDVLSLPSLNKEVE